jgi:regulator of protease activity HflC (stomatin/prohibitin superfamily)
VKEKTLWDRLKKEGVVNDNCPRVTSKKVGDKTIHTIDVGDCANNEHSNMNILTMIVCVVIIAMAIIIPLNVVQPFEHTIIQQLTGELNVANTGLNYFPGGTYHVYPRNTTSIYDIQIATNDNLLCRYEVLVEYDIIDDKDKLIEMHKRYGSFEEFDSGIRNAITGTMKFVARKYTVNDLITDASHKLQLEILDSLSKSNMFYILEYVKVTDLMLKEDLHLRSIRDNKFKSQINVIRAKEELEIAKENLTKLNKQQKGQ